MAESEENLSQYDKMSENELMTGFIKTHERLRPDYSAAIRKRNETRPGILATYESVFHKYPALGWDVIDLWYGAHDAALLGAYQRMLGILFLRENTQDTLFPESQRMKIYEALGTYTDQRTVVAHTLLDALQLEEYHNNVLDELINSLYLMGTDFIPLYMNTLQSFLDSHSTKIPPGPGVNVVLALGRVLQMLGVPVEQLPRVKKK